MRKLAMGLAVGAAALVTSAEAGACTRSYPRPSEMDFGPSYEDSWHDRRVPRLSQIIREASLIHIAIVRSIDPIPGAGANDRTVSGLIDLQPEYTMVLDVVDQFLGDSLPFYSIELAGGLPVATPTRWIDSSVDQDVEVVASLRSLDFREYPVGFLSRTSCGNATHAVFVPNRAYLILQNQRGEINLAVALSAEQLAAEAYEQGQFGDHVWVQAIENAIANPLMEQVHAASMREFLQAREPLQIVRITDCSGPSLRHNDWIGRTRRYSSELERDGFPQTMEELHESHYASPGPITGSFDPPVNEADLAALDEHRYDDVPFDAETCTVGQRYLHYNYRSFHAIDDNDVVDLTELPSQLFVSDLGYYPLEAVRSFIEEEAQE